ncbi:hypothetical protein [Lactococcus garvieae]|uniref:hypothetical protein n=1 Tax=Lactococcus garvieae TaxID=1363 RepID=UPI001CE2F5B2|nr:hypothetical protein [Lactococcus garvieae]
MHVFLGFTLAEWVAAVSLFTFVFGGCASLICYFRKSISGPMTLAIDELREDLKESREQRKENEGKLFGIADDHTKQLYNHEGRLNTLETITSSSVMRIDRAEKDLQGE